MTTLSSYFPFNLEQGNQFDLRSPGSALVDERKSDDDGFSLRDLVSYNEKHNEANGEENRGKATIAPGAAGQKSLPTTRKSTRARQQRNFLAAMFLSHGVPMLLGGDEIGRIQGGNNNAYCQDNEISWYDWAGLGEIMTAANPELNRDRPRIAFVVLSFNRAANIDQLVSGLRRIDDHELIVCDDGSLDGSREKWLSHLIQPNDFLILSNDLHEIRTFDRGIRFASAGIICLVQDDDIIPRETGWLDCVLEEFKKHPNLAIIGGFQGFYGFARSPGNEKPIWGDAPFQFVDHVNVGPYFIRKQHYEALGGWDFSFSRAGEPGVCFDSELCLRAWLNGYQVGYRFVPFKGPPQHYGLDGGTMLFSKEVRFRNDWRNHRKIFQKYSRQAHQITELVRGANRSIGLTTD